MKISRSHVRHVIVALGLVLAISFALPAFAEFPERPITLVVPRGAGGGTDTFGRSLAEALSKVLPVPVSVVNRPGAGGFCRRPASRHFPAGRLYDSSPLLRSIHDGGVKKETAGAPA